jgi:hypothetical protein
MTPPRQPDRKETKVNDQNARYARLRHTATGALAALVVVGAIAGTAALAAKPGARTRGHATVAKSGATKTPASPLPVKTHAPQPSANPQPFLNAIQQLVDNGTITATEGLAVDREIQTGRVDTDTLASSGFTQAQLQAVQQALGNAKRAQSRVAP